MGISFARFASIVLIGMSFNLNAISASTTAIDNTIATFEQQIQKTMKAQGIPGVAVAVVSKDKVLYVKGFGVKKVGSSDKITPQTLFQVASLSKPIHATLLAILQEQGKLSLQDPVHKHLPDFKLTPKNQPLKICHLISHSSGIPSAGLNEQIEAFAPRDKIVQRLKKIKAVSAPGSRFVYNNAMYGMSEDVITQVSGKKLETTLRDELFRPLNMPHICVGLGPLLNATNKAYPHVTYRGRYVPAPRYSSAYYAFSAAGGVNASVQDLIPFLQLYLGKPSPIISKTALNELTKPYVKNTKPVITYLAKKGVISNNFYGMGWNSMNYANQKIIYHQGHVKGFRSFMGYIDNDIGVIILTNAERKHAAKFAVDFFGTYLKNAKSV